MTIIPIPAGPGPAPDYRWVGPEVARRIRARCTTIGTVLLLWAILATVATPLLGSRLPTADHPIHDLAIVFAVAAAILPFIVGLYARGARRYVSAEHIDIAGGRVLGRGMLAMAVFTLVCAALAGAVLLLTARAVERTDAVQGAVVVAGASLLLPVSCGVIALVGAVLTRSALRRSSPPFPGRVAP